MLDVVSSSPSSGLYKPCVLVPRQPVPAMELSGQSIRAKSPESRVGKIQWFDLLQERIGMSDWKSIINEKDCACRNLCWSRSAEAEISGASLAHMSARQIVHDKRVEGFSIRGHDNPSSSDNS